MTDSITLSRSLRQFRSDRGFGVQETAALNRASRAMVQPWEVSLVISRLKLNRAPKVSPLQWFQVHVCNKAACNTIVREST